MAVPVNLHEDARPYRFNVGIALFNAAGHVFLGRAIEDGPELIQPGLEWQMPQGGIDPDEDIVAAARRELTEETGITEATFLAATDEWWRYDFPPHRPSGHRLEVYRGQQQRWVAFRFTGDERGIDLGATGVDFHPEFSAWRWTTLDEAIAGVVDYKRGNYQRMAAAFAHFAVPAV